MDQQPFFEIKKEEEKGNYSVISISPLRQGYGHTLGNSFRRVLMTSLPGAALTSVRIASVKHQFSTLKGMKEDIVDFCLNLKKVSVSYTGEKPIEARLVAKGAGEVKAGDIQVDPSVKIANPDMVVAYLNEGSSLDATITIESGYGYSEASERVTGEIGLIPLDALFSPITRVNYRVEETRVGRLTNYDRLVMEVWTNGTVDALDALKESATILIGYYNQVVDPKKVEAPKVEVATDDLGSLGKLSVEEIGLPTRVANALAKTGYETVEQVVKANRDELAKVRNLGEKSVKIIEAALSERGLAITG